MDVTSPVLGVSIHHALGGRPLWLIITGPRNSAESQQAATLAGHRLNRVLGGVNGHMAIDDKWNAYFTRVNEAVVVATYAAVGDTAEAQRAAEAARVALLDIVGGRLSDVTLGALTLKGAEVQLAVRKAVSHFGRIFGMATSKFDLTSVVISPEQPPEDATSKAVRAANDITASTYTQAVDAYMNTFSKSDTLTESLRALRPPAAALGFSSGAGATSGAPARTSPPSSCLHRQFKYTRAPIARLDLLPRTITRSASVAGADAATEALRLQVTPAAMRSTSAASTGSRTGPTRRPSRSQMSRESLSPRVQPMSSTQERPWAPAEVDLSDMPDEFGDAAGLSDAEIDAVLREPAAARVLTAPVPTSLAVPAASLDAVFGGSSAPASTHTAPAAPLGAFDMFGLPKAAAPASAPQPSVLDIFGMPSTSAAPASTTATVATGAASVAHSFDVFGGSALAPTAVPTTSAATFDFGAPAAAPMVPVAPAARPNEYDFVFGGSVAAPATTTVPTGDDLFSTGSTAAPVVASTAAAGDDWFGVSTAPAPSPIAAPAAPLPVSIELHMEATVSESVSISGRPGEPGAAAIQGNILLSASVAEPLAADIAGGGAVPVVVSLQAALPLASVRFMPPGATSAQDVAARPGGTTYAVEVMVPAASLSSTAPLPLGSLRYTVSPSVQPPIIKTLASCRATFAPATDGPQQQHRFVDVLLKTALHASFSHPLSNASFLLQLPPPLTDPAVASAGAAPSYAAPQSKPNAQWSSARNQLLWTLFDDDAAAEGGDDSATPRISTFLAAGRPTEFKARVPVVNGIVVADPASRSQVIAAPLQFRAALPKSAVCSWQVQASRAEAAAAPLRTTTGADVSITFSPVAIQLSSAVKALWKA